MSKPALRPYSRYGQDAVMLLGQMIRDARLSKKLTIAELAERVGVSRGLIYRIESGDLGCAIGAVFETAAILGIRLFDADQRTMDVQVAQQQRVLTLLPKTAHKSGRSVTDDF